MSYTEISLEGELSKIDDLQEEIGEKTDALRTFVASDDFLTDEKSFQTKFGAFQSSIIAATQIAEQFLAPMQPQQQLQTPIQEQTQKKEGAIGYGKIIVAVVALGLCYAALDREWITENVFLLFIGAALALMFLPGLLVAVRGLRNGDEEDAPLSIHQRLKKINDTLADMNRRYEGFMWITMIQNQGESTRYQMLGVDKRIYVRKEQAAVFLRFEFSAKINEIVRECNSTIWTRKTTIAMAMVEVARPRPQYPGRRRGEE